MGKYIDIAKICESPTTTTPPPRRKPNGIDIINEKRVHKIYENESKRCQKQNF